MLFGGLGLGRALFYYIYKLQVQRPVEVIYQLIGFVSWSRLMTTAFINRVANAVMRGPTGLNTLDFYKTQRTIVLPVVVDLDSELISIHKTFEIVRPGFAGTHETQEI